MNWIIVAGAGLFALGAVFTNMARDPPTANVGMTAAMTGVVLLVVAIAWKVLS